MAPPLLVVDDDDDWRAIVRARVEGEGLPVIEARSGREALDLLLRPDGYTPFCVLLDVDMPDMNGLELMRVLGSYLRLARIPVVVLSGAPPPSRIDSVSPARWLVKGTPWAEVLSAIEAHAPSHRRRRRTSSAPSGTRPTLSAVDEEADAFDDPESGEPPPAKTG